jgi:hypothetical protein
MPFGKEEFQKATREQKKRIFNSLFLLLFLPSCLQVEYHLKLFHKGTVTGTVLFILPSIGDLPEMEERIGGKERNPWKTYEVQGVKMKPAKGKRNEQKILAGDIRSLSLPWIQFTYEEKEGKFSYHHAIAFPPDLLKEMERRIERRLSLLHAPEKDPEGMKKNLLNQGKVVVRISFPGKVTETNGNREDKGVEWSYPLTALKEGTLLGYSRGKISFFRKIWDPIYLFFLRLFW